jgi:hypothetical protein
MAVSRCRITVVGTSRRVDVSVPVYAPIAEYVLGVAKLCGQDRPAGMDLPPVWSLRPATGPVLAPETSLADAGVADGAVLHLHDHAAGEFDEPEVFDLGETVTREGYARQSRWDARARTTLLQVASATFLSGAALDTAWATPQHLTPPAGLAAAAVILLAVLGLARLARRHTATPVAPAVLIVAGLCCEGAAAGRAGGLAGGAAGVALAAVLAFALVPGAVSLSLLAAAAPAAAVVAALAAAHVDATAMAGTGAMLVTFALPAAPWLAARLAQHAPGQPDDTHQRTQEMLARAYALAAGATLVLATVLGVLLVVLSASPRRYALALALCLSVVALLRCAESTATLTVLARAGVGVVGLLALLLSGTRHIAVLAGWGAPAAAAAGLLLLAGAAIAGRASQRPVGQSPRWVGVAAPILTAAAIAPLMGLLGVLHLLVGVGNRL